MVVWLSVKMVMNLSIFVVLGVLLFDMLWW